MSKFFELFSKRNCFFIIFIIFFTVQVLGIVRTIFRHRFSLKYLVSFFVVRDCKSICVFFLELEVLYWFLCDNIRLFHYFSIENYFQKIVWFVYFSSIIIFLVCCTKLFTYWKYNFWHIPFVSKYSIIRKCFFLFMSVPLHFIIILYISYTKLFILFSCTTYIIFTHFHQAHKKFFFSPYCFYVFHFGFTPPLYN